MGAQADLVAAASASAAAAKDADGPVARREHAEAAKVALEAARLAEDVGPGEIAAALNDLQAELEAADLLAESLELEPAEVLKVILDAVATWRRAARMAQGYADGYVLLEALLQGLERDFIAGDTDTSRRIAARIKTALDDAANTIKQATSQEG